MAKKSAAKSKYKAHPGLSSEAADKEKLKKATGKTFEQWVAFARSKGPEGQKACRMWLRAEHGHGMREAWWIAAAVAAKEEEAPDYANPESMVDTLYSGDKAALRPVHEAVVDAAIALGDDVIPTSCQTMVPIYRKHVFVELKPVDGVVEAALALGHDVAAKGRLLPPDGRMPGDRLTHVVRLAKVGDVDAEFKGWLAAAYANGAGAMKRKTTAEMPGDLAKSLKGGPAKARATWDDSTPAMQRDWILWIESAKQAETRTKRIGQTIEKLAAGKKRMY